MPHLSVNSGRVTISLMIQQDNQHQPSVSIRNLQRLFWLRNLMVSFLGSIALMLCYMDIPLPMQSVAWALGLMAALNAMTWWRLRFPTHVGEVEVLFQLLGDIFSLTLLFYFTGGYSNPLVWMYLLPLAVAAVALRPVAVWIIAVLVVLSYSALVFYHVPLSHLHEHYRAGIGLDIHLVGMWLGFVVSAVVIAVFVARIGQNLREYDRLMSEARERLLESERMMALGTLATAAAHELGSPLAVMALLAGEMSDEFNGQPALQASLVQMRAQIARCKAILATITASAGQPRADVLLNDGLDNYLTQMIAQWRDLHPAVVVECRFMADIPAPLISVDRTLGQALVNLLDNATEAAARVIEIEARWDDETLQLSLRDDGVGIAPSLAEKIGTPFFSTKESEGMGLGVYLSRSIFELMGGAMRLENHPDGGSIVFIEIPMTALIQKKSLL